MTINATGRSSRGSMTGGNLVPKGFQRGQLQQFTPEQMDLFKQLFSHVEPDSFLSKLAGGDEGAFAQMEEPAMRQFQALQGQIGSRFSGMGTGALKSSGFRNTINQATSDFASDLASRRHELQRQALGDLMGMSQQLLGQRPYDQFLTQKPLSFWQQLAVALGGPAVQAGGLLGSSYIGRQNPVVGMAKSATGSGEP